MEAYIEMAIPCFDFAHCVIGCLSVRDDLKSGASEFARKHPLACYLSTMVTIFAGGMIANLLLGESVIGGFKNNQLLVIATLVWFAVFYSPLDIGYGAAKYFPVKVVLSVMKEVYRVKKINDGVVSAIKVFPNGFLIMVIIGTIKGNGSGFMKIIARLMRGVWNPASIEVMKPSFTTKASILASLIFMLHKNTDYIFADHSFVFFVISSFFVVFKLSSILLGTFDPLIPFEKMLSFVFFGGLSDYITESLGGTVAIAETSSEASVNGDEGKNKKE